MNSELGIQRRALLAAAGAGLVLSLGAGASAQAIPDGLTGLLAAASDRALDRLAQPGAFYNDTAVRIQLPGVGNLGSQGGSLLGGLAGEVAGMTGLDGVTRKINDAGDRAAQAAKPIFHAAISRLTLSDVPGIATQRDGGTQYLRRTAGGELRAKVRPLIDTALTAVGAFQAIESLSGPGGLLRSLGLTRESVGASVTDQALNGIYRYMAEEEAKLRANPLGFLGGAGAMLGGMHF